MCFGAYVLESISVCICKADYPLLKAFYRLLMKHLVDDLFCPCYNGMSWWVTPDLGSLYMLHCVDRKVRSIKAFRDWFLVEPVQSHRLQRCAINVLILETDASQWLGCMETMHPSTTQMLTSIHFTALGYGTVYEWFITDILEIYQKFSIHLRITLWEVRKHGDFRLSTSIRLLFFIQLHSLGIVPFKVSRATRWQCCQKA